MAKISANRILDRKSFEIWLAQLPEAERRVVAVVLASRSAMRGVPFLCQNHLGSDFPFPTIVKFAFWRNLIARSVRVWPDDQIVSLADIALRSHFETDNANFAEFSGAVLASTAALFVAAAALSEGTLDSVANANLAAASHHQYGSRFWRELSSDAAHIDRSGLATHLFSRPLWTDKPKWFEDALSRFKEAVSTTRRKKEDWPIWLEWYAPIVDGNPAFGLKSRKAADDIERAIALGSRDGGFDKKFWEREPREINAEIRQWVAEAQTAEGQVSTSIPTDELELPHQSLDATVFGLTANGKIARVAVPPEQQLLITPQQQKEYEALREDSLELAGRGQVLGQVGAHVDALLLALPVDMSHARVFDVWRALNRLRRTMNSHQRVADFPEPHEAKLEPAIAEDLAALLRTANIFAFGDPGLLRRDELAIAPQDRPALQTEKALGDELASAAQNMPEMFTEDALGSVVAEESNAAGAGDDPHGLQAIDQTNKTRRNWIAVILGGLKAEGGFAWKEMRSGAYKKTGEAGSLAAGIAVLDAIGVTAFYPAIWKFVSLHGANLLSYVKSVYQNPTLTAFVEQVLRSVGL